MRTRRAKRSQGSCWSSLVWRVAWLRRWGRVGERVGRRGRVRHLVSGPGWVSALVLLLTATAARGDGWHNAALFTGDLDNWAKQEAQGIPPAAESGQSNTKSRLKVGVGRPPGQAGATESAAEPDAKTEKRLGGNLNAQQQNQLMMKAQNFVEVLAYMRSDNILKPEFPNFNHALIPKYREKAYELLQRSGSAGTQAAKNVLRDLLMGGGPQGDVNGFHPDFVRQMLSTFEGGLQSNHYSASELLELLALTDTRQPQVGQLAKAVQNAVDKQLQLADKLELADEAGDQKRVRDMVMNMIRGSLDEADPNELAVVLTHPAAPSLVRQQAVLRLQKELPKLDLLGLLSVIQGVDDPSLRNAARQLLRAKSPQLGDLLPNPALLASFVSDPDPIVNGESKRVLQLALSNAQAMDAPLMLEFLASSRSAESLARVAVPELTRKLANLSPADREPYRQAAKTVLTDRQNSVSQHEAALWLLSRLGSKDKLDKAAVTVIVDALPQLQKGAFESAGRALQGMTGQTFGPQAGASISQVQAVQKRWKQWLQTQP